MRKGRGTPLAYLDAEGRAVSCPFGEKVIDAHAVFPIVDSERAPRARDLQSLLA